MPEKPDQQPSPYEHTKFVTTDQEAVHNGLVKLIRGKLGEDMADLPDGDVLEAAHLAYAPDMDPQDFVSGAKIVMSEKMREGLQAEADRRATEAGQEGLVSRLALKNLHIGPQPIKGIDVSGKPGVEERKAVLKTVGKAAGEVGKGLVKSLPGVGLVTAPLEWVAAHGLTEEEIAPGVYETRFAGGHEQDKLEREAVRKVAQAALDNVGWGLGAAEVAGVMRLPGFTNAFARMGVEGAGWGATYEGVDSALAGESADRVAGRAVTGAAIGAGVTLGLGSLLHGAAYALRGLVRTSERELAARAAALGKPVSDLPAAGLSAGERVALNIQRDGIASLPDEARRYADLARQGRMDPQEAAIHVLGHLGVVNDPAGVASVERFLRPNALVPLNRTLALTVPDATALRLAEQRGAIEAAAAARRMAEEANATVAELSAQARAERWGAPDAVANLAERVPEPIVLPSGDQPILLGPGTNYVPDAQQALREAATQMPHLRFTREPRTVQGKLVASVYKPGTTAYDLLGAAQEVLGYSTSGRVITRRLTPEGTWVYSALAGTDLSPNPSGFVPALARLEAGARARLARIERNPRLHSGLSSLEGAKEWVEIGIGKFGRVAYLASKAGLSKDQVYIMWANDMAAAMKAAGHGDKVQFLPKMFAGIEKDYGTTVANLVLRDSSLREGLYDAMERLKKLGLPGHDWYDNTFPKLVELFGSVEDAADFADFLAITSANRNIDSNTNLALQAFAMWQVGEVPRGFGPNIDAMFARWAKAAQYGSPPVRAFASKAGAPKVSEFVQNVRGADINGVTLDIWMNRYLRGKETMTTKEKEAAKAIIREIAAKEGLTPRQVQAAMWADARVAAQILGPFNKTGKVDMKLGSLRPYEETTGLFLKKRGGFIPEAAALKATREKGGGTFYAGSYTPYDKPGFAVALGGAKPKPVDKMLPNQLRKAVNGYLEPLKKIAADKGVPLEFTVGTWVEEGKIYAEVGVVLKDRQSALHLAEVAKQKAIAELGEGGEFKGTINTTHEKASANSVTDAKKYLKEWLETPSAKGVK